MAKLCFLAGVSESTYKNILSGETVSPHVATLDRLDRTLEAGQTPPSPLIAVCAAMLRAVTGELAREYRKPIDRVLAADFSIQRPRDPVWLAASKLRRLAIYVVKVELPGVDADTLAIAAGCTKQNVGQALAQIEDRREQEPRLDRILDRVRARLTGRA